jgi:glycine cleavage system H protein
MVAIFVALMFIGLILLDVLIQKLEERRTARARILSADEVLSQLTKGRGRLGDWVSVPEGVYLADGHAWALPQEKGTVRAGADGLISRALGHVSRVTLPNVGDEVPAGMPLFHLELNRRVLTVASPVSGRVVAVNRQLQERPGLVAEDPFGAGWVCSVVPTRQAHENGTMRCGATAAKWLAREVARFREFISARLAPDLALGLISQDGGAPVPGCLARFDAGAWIDFEREFLRPR